MNSIDFMLGDSELIALRSREVTDRPLLAAEISSKLFWKVVNMIFPTILIILLGVFVFRYNLNKSKKLDMLYE